MIVKGSLRNQTAFCLYVMRCGMEILVSSKHKKYIFSVSQDTYEKI